MLRASFEDPTLSSAAAIAIAAAAVKKGTNSAQLLGNLRPLTAGNVRSGIAEVLSTPGTMAGLGKKPSWAMLSPAPQKRGLVGSSVPGTEVERKAHEVEAELDSLLRCAERWQLSYIFAIGVNSYRGSVAFLIYISYVCCIAYAC